jgi:hypothetical protein
MGKPVWKFVLYTIYQALAGYGRDDGIPSDNKAGKGSLQGGPPI